MKGSDIYQEMLTKALAKHFGAKLLIVDSLLLPGVISFLVFMWFSLLLIYYLINFISQLIQGSIVKEVDLVKENAKSERAAVFAKRAAHAAALHLKKTVSGGEADIPGGSATCSPVPPKQEASPVSSKSYTFKRGSYCIIRILL